MATTHISLIQRLGNDLQEIERQLGEYLKVTRVGCGMHNMHYLHELDPDGKRTQATLLKAHRLWTAHVNLLIRDAPSDTKKEVEEANKHLNQWIERVDLGWWVPESVLKIKQQCDTHLDVLRGVLSDLGSGDDPPIVLLPDTNALLACADWERYVLVAGVASFSIVIPPSVLKELDKLKVNHRDPVFRDKVNSVIRRIKGLRIQGKLTEGVTVSRTIQIRLVAQEPDFTATLGWLDPTNDDDRIIASSLEFQRQVPNSVVVLVTSDINMQTKAEAARLPFAEPPDAV